MIETYHPCERGRFDYAEAQCRTGSTAEFCGPCPDEDDLIGVECWMPDITGDHIPDGTVFIYCR